MGHDQTDKVGCHCSVAFLFITDNKPNRFPNFFPLARLLLSNHCLLSQSPRQAYPNRFRYAPIDGYIRFAVYTFVSQHFLRLRIIFRYSVFSLCKSAHIIFVTGIDRTYLPVTIFRLGQGSFVRCARAAFPAPSG